MAIFDEIRQAGLTKQFAGMLLGALLVVLQFPTNLPGYIGVVLWMLLMVVSTGVYMRRFATRFSPAILLIPMIIGYLILVQTAVIYAGEDNALMTKMSPVSLAGICVTWMSFTWLLATLDRNRGSAKLKNSEKSKNES